MKKALLWGVAACAATLAWSDTAYPLYVLDTAAGSMAEPVKIDEQTLIKYASAEDETGEEVAFSSLGEPTGGTFVKRGAGFVLSSAKFKSFRGEFRVEGGGLVVNAPYQTGPMTSGTKPVFAVSNNASFVIAATVTPPTTVDSSARLIRHAKFVLRGAGVDGEGAIKNLSTVDLNYCFGNVDFELEDDVIFGSRSTKRWDCGSSSTINMNGHLLTIRGFANANDRNGSFTIDSTTVSNPYKIVVDHTGLLLQGTPVFKGGDTNAIEFGDYSYLSLWKAAFTASRLPWTIRFKEGAKGNNYINAGGSVYDEYNGAQNYIYAPIDTRELTRVSAGTAGQGLMLYGPVSGPGGLATIYGKGALALCCPTNSFQGPVSVVGDGTQYAQLQLYADGALPATSAGVALTNAHLRLRDNVNFTLPPLAFHLTSVPAGTNYMFEGGLSATTPSLVKSGAKKLEVRTPLSVSGRIRLLGGTLQIPPPDQNRLGTMFSAVPGLWAEVVEPVLNPETGKGLTYQPAFTNNAYLGSVSNKVAYCPEMLLAKRAYPPFTQYATYIYSGYVWNRSPTNETWSFASAVYGAARVLIDGRQAMGADNNGAVSRARVEMKPGPHHFVYKLCTRNYAPPGAHKNGVPTWDDNMGLGIDRQGRNSTNAVDYVFAANALRYNAGGDGYLFTRDARDVSEFTAEELDRASAELLPMADLEAVGGTTLDFADPSSECILTNLVGTTFVTNGSLSVRGTWKLKAADHANWPLKVTGDLSFSSATLDLDTFDFAVLPRGIYDIATTEGTLSGAPKLADSFKNTKWHLGRKGANTLVLFYQSGLKVILR
ncbi:MAG: hypothetical protein MJ240_11040 [Kiritimatiellae bacterium]|nr:hypothetical protein [Kiritimatiellia bacterium]